MNNENFYFLFKPSLTFKPPDNWNQFALPMVLDYRDSTEHFLLTSISKPDVILSIVLNVMRTKV